MLAKMAKRLTGLRKRPHDFQPGDRAGSKILVKGLFMKRSWRAITAASLLALCAPAYAEPQFDWGGQGNFSAYSIDQDDIPGGDVNDFGFAAEGKVWGRVRMVTDSGIEYGLRTQLRFQSSEHEFSNDDIRGAPEFVDEVWAYVQTAFGRLTIGLEDGAADSAGIYSPSVSDINRIDDARAFVVQDPRQPSFAAFEPNGAHLRTDLNATGDALKVIYYSPRLIGIQLSASYTPDLRRGLDELFDSSPSFNRQEDIWEVGLNYQGSLSSFDVGFYAGYVSGSNSDPALTFAQVTGSPSGPPGTFFTRAFVPDDLEEWGAGAQVVYEGLKLGGSYRSTNIAGGAGIADLKVGAFSSNCTFLGSIKGCVLPDARTEIWSAGVEYETGPWSFGVNYVDLTEELPLSGTGGLLNLDFQPGDQKANAWSGAVGYEFDENLRMGVGYQRYSFEGPANGCVAAACDTLDADVAYFETSFSF
jgi:predicted porin